MVGFKLVNLNPNRDGGEMVLAELLYTYGGAPPVAVAVRIPSDLPKHVTGVEVRII